jgi:hypothetical protein
MKFLILIILIFSICNLSYCQDKVLLDIKKNCCSRLKAGKENVLSQSRGSVLIEYLLNEKLISSNHLYNRLTNNPVEVLIRTSNQIIFKDDSFKITISKEIVDTNSLVLKYDSFPEFFESKKIISRIDNKVPCGINTVEDMPKSLDRIGSIKIHLKREIIDLDISEIDNLFFPNFNNTYFSIQPINIFLSDCRRYVYVYIYGDLNFKNDKYIYWYASNFSYMAKVIISLEQEKIIGVETINSTILSF